MACCCFWLSSLTCIARTNCVTGVVSCELLHVDVVEKEVWEAWVACLRWWVLGLRHPCLTLLRKLAVSVSVILTLQAAYACIHSCFSAKRSGLLVKLVSVSCYVLTELMFGRKHWTIFDLLLMLFWKAVPVENCLSFGWNWP